MMMFAVALCIAVAGLTVAGVPSLLPILLFGGSMAAAEHRDRLFGDETSVSGSLAVALATVLVFARGSWLTGPMVCAGFAGCYWPHLRQRAWSRVAVNTAAMSLAAGGSASVVHVLVAHDRFGINLAVAGVVAVGVFWVINSAVLALAVSSIQQGRLIPTTWHLVCSDVGLLPFGYMGFLTGVLTGAGLVDVWLALLGVLVLLDQALLRAPHRSSKAPLVWSVGILGATIAGIVLAVTAVPSTTTTLALLCAGGLVSFTIAEELRPGVGIGVVVAAAVAASIALQPTQPVVGAVLVGIATCSSATFHCRTVQAVVRSTCAVAIASLSIGFVAAVYPDIGGAIVPAMTFGLIAGTLALVLWHATQGMWLIVQRERNLYRSAVDVFIADAPIGLAAGVLGAAAGWGIVRSGPSDVVLAAVLAVVAVRVVAVLLSKRGHTQLLPRDDLFNVVCSAVLDLPASRLPEGKSEGSRTAR